MQYAVDIESARIKLLGSCAGLLMISVIATLVAFVGYQFLHRGILRMSMCLESFPAFQTLWVDTGRTS